MSRPRCKIFTVRSDEAREDAIAFLRRARLVNDSGEPLQIVLRRQRKRRTLPQNSLWHGWIHIMAVHAGETDAQMKKNVKEALLPLVERINPFTGVVSFEPRETSSLQKEEMTVFMTQTQALALEQFDITLPTPDDPESWQAFDEYRGAA